MPDFTEILKIAFEKQDWNIISGLYKNITGETLSLSKEEEKHEDPVLSRNYEIEDIVQKEEKDEESVDRNRRDVYNDFKAPPRQQSSSKNNSGRQMRSEPVGARPLKNVVGVSENGFVDDMTESLLDPETGEKLTGKNDNVKITPRNRRRELGMNNTSMINVVCSLCEENLRISSVLANGYSDIPSQNSWVCNDCNTRKGRRERSRE
jgi:hypothetical protein